MLLSVSANPLTFCSTKGSTAQPQIEQIEQRDPVTGETQTVKRIIYDVTHNAMCEQPQVFGAGAALVLGAYSAQVRSALQMIDFHLRLLR
jgi:hypothetical protein